MKAFALSLVGIAVLLEAAALSGQGASSSVETAKVVSQALVQVAETGERGYEAEVYRLQGVIRARLSDASAAAQAEASFRRAVAIAREQRARGWEVRAATDLAHLLRRQGRGPEARRCLDEILPCFAEGLDLPDLRAARTLQSALLSEGH